MSQVPWTTDAWQTTLPVDCWAAVAQELCTTDALALLMTCSNMLQALSAIDEVWHAHATALARDELVHDSMLNRPGSESALHRLLRLRGARLRLQPSSRDTNKKDPLIFEDGRAAGTHEHGNYYVDLRLPRLAVDEVVAFVLDAPDDKFPPTESQPFPNRAYHNLVVSKSGTSCVSSAEELPGHRMLDFSRTQLERMGVNINHAGLRCGRFLVMLSGLGSERAERRSLRAGAAVADLDATSGHRVAEPPLAAARVQVTLSCIGGHLKTKMPMQQYGYTVDLGIIAADQPLVLGVYLYAPGKRLHLRPLGHLDASRGGNQIARAKRLLADRGLAVAEELFDPPLDRWHLDKSKGISLLARGGRMPPLAERERRMEQARHGERVAEAGRGSRPAV